MCDARLLCRRTTAWPQCCRGMPGWPSACSAGCPCALLTQPPAWTHQPCAARSALHASATVADLCLQLSPMSAFSLGCSVPAVWAGAPSVDARCKVGWCWVLIVACATQVLSLQLLKILLENSGSVFRNSERFQGAIKQHLCLSLLKNVTVPSAQVRNGGTPALTTASLWLEFVE